MTTYPDTTDRCPASNEYRCLVCEDIYSAISYPEYRFGNDRICEGCASSADEDTQEFITVFRPIRISEGRRQALQAANAHKAWYRLHA